jgi:hypothetical protein
MKLTLFSVALALPALALFWAQMHYGVFLYACFLSLAASAAYLRDSW